LNHSISVSGEDDVIAIFELPDNATIAALSLALAASASALVRTRTIPLLTVEEVDKALAKNPNYRAGSDARAYQPRVTCQLCSCASSRPRLISAARVINRYR